MDLNRIILESLEIYNLSMYRDITRWVDGTPTTEVTPVTIW